MRDVIRLEFFDVIRVPATLIDGVPELEVPNAELIQRFVTKADRRTIRTQHQNQFAGFETDNETSSSGDEDHQPRKRDLKDSGNGKGNQDYKKGPGGAGG